MFFFRKNKPGYFVGSGLGSNIGSDDKIERLQSVYKIAMQTREFEISQLIQRNNFFMLFQGVFLAAAFQNQASKPYVEFWLSLLGVFMSLYQVQVAAGAKYWQEYWEVRLGEIEKSLMSVMKGIKEDGFEFEPLFSEDAKNLDIEEKVRDKTKKKYTGCLSWLPTWFMVRKYSVSRVPIVAGITLLIFWFVLFVQTIGLKDGAASFFSGWEISTPFEIKGHYFSSATEKP